jgi:hypothetical protein
MVSISNLAAIFGIGAIIFLATRAGTGIASALENLQLPSIGDVSFPDISFPEIPNPFGTGSSDAGSVVADAAESASDVVQDVVSQEFSTVPQEEQTPLDPLGAGLGGLFAGGAEFLNQIFGTPNNAPEVQGPPDFSQAGVSVDIANQIANVTGAIPEPEPVIVSPPGVPIPVEDPDTIAPAFGGGINFQGGTIFSNPIDTLGEVIDEFGVGATKAADILARINNDTGDFPFGTNTGSGIGSVVAENPEINTSIPNLGAVSNPEFEGLSAEEIVNRLTGGNISNF